MKNQKVQSILNNNDNKEQDKPYEDCLPCKITGSLAFTGLGGYALHQAKVVNKIPGKQGTAVGLGVAGVGKFKTLQKQVGH